MLLNSQFTPPQFNMGLPGLFEVYQLAIGPGTVLTTGALRIGQAFREVLLSSPYRPGYRILIELTGLFSNSGRANNSDQAVVAGLGGFSLENPDVRLKSFYRNIKENGYFAFGNDIWPFNPESDLVFSETEKIPGVSDGIRFHLVSNDGQPAFQAEYVSIGNGFIKGPGVKVPDSRKIENSAINLQEIKSILWSESLSLVEFMISGECSIHRISRDQVKRRMLSTWKLMNAHIDKGIKSQVATQNQGKQQGFVVTNNFLPGTSPGPFAGVENSRIALYAFALSREITDNQMVITSPTCSGSVIVPAVFRHLQERFMFPDDKMVEGLLVAGLFGSIILHHASLGDSLTGMQQEIAYSAIMAAAGGTFLMGGALNEIENSASMATLLYGRPFGSCETFDPGMFSLHNSMVAQTIPSLIDLARIQEDGAIPFFDEALKGLFYRK